MLMLGSWLSGFELMWSVVCLCAARASLSGLIFLNEGLTSLRWVLCKILFIELQIFLLESIGWRYGAQSKDHWSEEGLTVDVKEPKILSYIIKK